MVEQASWHGISKGMTFAERYVVIEERGQGGMATVFQALDIQKNQLVALKVLMLPAQLPEADRDLRIQRFQNEATIMSLLDHPHITGFQELIEQDGHYYMVLEWLEGQELTDLAPTLRHTPGKLLKLLDQVADALEYIHARGMIHLDLKPENIMVVDNGQHVKLLDFGIARIEGMETEVSRHALVGTVTYMSPEQLQNSKLTQAQSDIYSLGVVMYETLTGTKPHNADSHAAAMLMVLNHEAAPPLQLNPLIGPDLNDLILICMHKQPEHRFANCRQLRQLLRVLLQRVFYDNAPLDAALQSILPRIHLFADFGLYQALTKLVESQATGQCLIWNAYQEAGVWLQNGNILYADVKNKSLDPVQAFFDIVAWEAGNFIFIPRAKLPPETKIIRQNAYDLLREAYAYSQNYQILWDMYRKDDVPEIVLMPGAGDKLSEIMMYLLEVIDGQVPVGKLHAILPYDRMALLEALQAMDDRQFVFMDRVR